MAKTPDVWDEPEDSAPDWSPDKEVREVSDRDRITVSLKGGSGVQAWVVGHFMSVEEAMDVLNHPEWDDLMKLIAQRGTELQEAHGGKAPQAAPAARGNTSWGKKTTTASRSSQRGSQGQVAWDKEARAFMCEHGEADFKEGESAKGPWAGYFCPEPEKDEQCKPKWKN